MLHELSHVPCYNFPHIHLQDCCLQRLLHLPGYIKNFDRYKEKGISKIVCIAVNDPNVMQAWGDNQKVNGKISYIPHGASKGDIKLESPHGQD